MASPFQDLSGDVSDWGAGSTGGGTCSSSVGEVYQPRGVGADKFGNVYIGETANGRYRVVLGPLTSPYFTGNNPLYALIEMNPAYPTANQGYIYPLLFGFSAQTANGITYNIPSSSGGACQSGTGASAATATDAYGDGCQYFATAASGSTSNVQGITADGYGNVIIPDAVHQIVRVIYAGGANAEANPMYTAIVANNPSVTPTAGFIYALAGGGSTGPSTSPALGTSLSLGSTSLFKVAIGPGGNLYFGDSSGTAVYLYDVSTGYMRELFKSGTACSAHVSGASNGDGCPAGSFSFAAGNGLGVAVDPLGNLYLGDENSRLREIEATSLIPTTVGSTTNAGTSLTETLLFHGPVGISNMTATALNAPADITLGSVTCGAANSDQTMDCTVPVTFAPAQPGPRTLNLAVTALNSTNAALGSAVFPVSGTGVGSALVADVATPATATVSSNTITPVTIAVDGAGNTYTVDTTAGAVLRRSESGTVTTVGTAPSGAAAIAVDTYGDVYVVGSSAVTKYTLATDGTYSAASFATGVATPQAIAVDAIGNVYVADKTTGSVVELAAESAFATSQGSETIAQGFTNPVGLAIGGQGNIFVADQGAPAVYRIQNVNGVMTTTAYAAGSAVSVTATPGATASSASPAITISNLVPVAVAADAGGNVYVQDATSDKTLLLPVSTASATSVTVLSGLQTPAGVAVDGNGVVYSVDAGAKVITQVERNAASYSFGTSSGTASPFSGYLGNVGNLAATGYAQTTSSEFLYDVTGTSTCGTIPSASNTLNFGADCAFTAYFNPATDGNLVTSVTTLLPAASAIGSLTLTGQEPTGTTYATTTTISNPTPSNPVFVSSGTTASFTVTVSATGTSDVPSGAVTVTTSCASGAGSYPLTSGSATVALSGCTAGAQSINVAYANTPDPNNAAASFGASSNAANFNVGQASVSVSWTPSATTQQFSAALGSGVLDATASSGATPVAGYFLYTATPSAGSAQTVHAASYLAIGTYTLGVTFVPTDTTDYAQASASVSNYTVTQASTTAAIGETQLLVAADGSGNYTSVQQAVNAVPSTGGSVYIKPGTYDGDVTIVQPNLSLRGLGGDPTKVILTHSGGAFGGSGVYAYAGEFTSAQNNSSQLPSGSSTFTGDEASATLVVAKGTNAAVSPSQLTPNNFYAENLTLQNTYDSDNTTTTTTYLPGSNSGTCTANEGPAETYLYLYNQSLLCASQALAIWITGDMSVMNNVYTTSLQDTIYAGSQGSGSNGYVPSRQYWFRGKVTGNVDYIFGDAAAVFDNTTIYSMLNKKVGNNGTIEAQNKAVETGSSGDYLSGYVMNSDVFTSDTGTTTYFGRPYGTYSTWVMLNSYVDEVVAAGYEEFSNSTDNLPTSTYTEYNDIPYTDPSTGTADLNGVTYTGGGGNSGAGVTGPRETASQDPGTPMAANTVKTSMTPEQATLYYPAAFLGTTVSSSVSNTTNWNPTAALAADVNAFVPSGASATINYGSTITVLMRPQTPGLGAVTNGAYTIPTGTYTLYDNGTQIASGTLDASGEAYMTSSTLAVGSHSLTWTYGGDSNFAGSTTSTPLVITVNQGSATTTTLNATTNPITYGQSASVTATVAPQSGSATPTGTVTGKAGGANAISGVLSGGSTSLVFTGLTGGSYNVTGTYSGDSVYASSTSTALTLVVDPATLTATPSCANRLFDQPNSCTVSVTGYQYTDSASTVFTTAPTAVTSATRISPVGSYNVTATSSTLSTSGSANYVVNSGTSSFNVTGGVPQYIIFPPLPNFASGQSYQLAARASSGLPITYTVTSGNASVNGSTLTVNGSGSVTVEASCTDSSGTYAAATPVSRSFTAQ